MNKLRYRDLAHNEKTLLALTGLKPAEFEHLLVFFTEAWMSYIGHFTLEGKPRERQHRPSKARKNATLPTVEDKLLFVLYYLKTNPLQEALATSFGMRQPHASFWLGLLLPGLEEALEKAHALPERQSQRLHRAVAAHERVLIDATERPIGRSTDYETQKEHYSGKKNAIR